MGGWPASGLPGDASDMSAGRHERGRLAFAGRIRVGHLSWKAGPHDPPTYAELRRRFAGCDDGGRWLHMQKNASPACAPSGRIAEVRPELT